MLPVISVPLCDIPSKSRFLPLTEIVFAVIKANVAPFSSLYHSPFAIVSSPMSPAIHTADENGESQPSFSLILEDISPFCGATDIAVLDFWWRLPRVSKPGWISRLLANLLQNLLFFESWHLLAMITAVFTVKTIGNTWDFIPCVS